MWFCYVLLLIWKVNLDYELVAWTMYEPPCSVRVWSPLFGKIQLFLTKCSSCTSDHCKAVKNKWYSQSCLEHSCTKVLRHNYIRSLRLQSRYYHCLYSYHPAISCLHIHSCPTWLSTISSENRNNTVPTVLALCVLLLCNHIGWWLFWKKVAGGQIQFGKNYVVP